jgi:hypothetical protein
MRAAWPTGARLLCRAQAPTDLAIAIFDWWSMTILIWSVGESRALPGDRVVWAMVISVGLIG